jgi:hypothetical protein
MTLNRALKTSLYNASGTAAFGTAGTAATPVLTVQGIAAMTPILATVTATNLDVQIGGSDSLTIGTFPDNEPINVAQMAGATTPMTTTQADNLALTLDGLNATSFNYIHDGTNWDMMRGDTTNGVDVDVTRMPADATELPAAAALADATANPTVPAVAAFLMGWNGTTWDRVRAAPDPCSSGTKVFVPISQTTGTQLLTGTASNRTYVCSINIVTATAQNIALVSGTGSVCATSTGAMMGGTTAATGWNLAANGGIVVSGGGASVAKSDTDADNVCLLQSSTGQISGTLVYVVAAS